MNWTDEPATWKQLRFLRQHGYQPERRLSKTEASELITRFGGCAATYAGLSENDSTTTANAYHFHKGIEEAKAFGFAAQTHSELTHLLAERQEFWIDTCRETTRMKVASQPVLELYRQHGCLYCEPTLAQVQAILEALDSAMPCWDRDHPELFYQALRMNFPELVRHP